MAAIEETNGSVKPFDLERVRPDFPILATEVNGHPLVYLDNAATGQKPASVIEAERRYYLEDNANIHRGVHTLSQRATGAYEKAREVAARFLGLESDRELVFVRGTTEGVNLVAQSFLRPRIKAGDKILLTTMEHHANIVPWQLLRDEVGLELVVCPLNEKGEVELETWQGLLDQHRPAMAAMVHASNALGTINPAAEMIAAARALGIPTLLDAAQSAPHFSIDLPALDPDFLVLSAHKLFGPTGIGLLYGKAERLEEMKPYQGGGDMIETVTFEKTTFKAPPERFEAGTPNIAGVITFAEALKYLMAMDRTGAEAHESSLRMRAEAGLREIPGLRIIGEAENKVAVVSFVMESAHSHDIGTFLDQEGIAIRTGHHCCMPLMQSLEIPGTARASFAFYNTEDEVDRLIAGVAKIERFFR
jgi:cysteine desulfurase/selenocysteine lyase|tara:strand:+ start:19801 stop:21057 length:1257 start_codon:yes stop_codon:yes gene_type:complete